MEQKMTVDARGLSCPQPVVEAMNALKKPADRYEILVDNQTAVENVSRFLNHAHRTFQVREDGPDFIIEVS